MTFDPQQSRISRFVVLIGLVSCVASAWMAQVSFHVQTGGTPPELSAYNLLGAWGRAYLPELNTSQPFTVYVLAALCFAALALLVRGVGSISPALRSIHLEPEPCYPNLDSPPPLRRFTLALAAVFSGVLFVVFLLATVANSRLGLLSQPDAELALADRILKELWHALGLRRRANTWVQLATWITYVLALFSTLWCCTKALGYRWSYGGIRDRLESKIRAWEWACIAAVAVSFTAGYMWESDRIPYTLMQSEAQLGMAALALTKVNGPSIFGNLAPGVSYVGAIPRVLPISLIEDPYAALRYSSGFVAGLGIIIAYATLRNFFGVVASLFTTILLGSTHTVIHYARLGWNSIDAPYWVFLLLFVFYRAEVSPPGVGRFSKYFASGALCAVSFGLYPSAQLGAVLVVGLLICRSLTQPDFLRGRAAAAAAFLLAFVAALAPILFSPDPPLARANQAYVLNGEKIGSYFPGTDADSADSVDEFLLQRTLKSMRAYYSTGDRVMEYSTPFPLAGPLLASLSILGAAVLLTRPRAWINLFVFGLYFGGAFLGGALLVGPDPPSSARLLVLLPAVAIAAAAAVDRIVAVFRACIQPIPGTGKQGWRGVAIPAIVAGVVLLAWAGLSEIGTNLDLYRRFLRDPNLRFHRSMEQRTELQRFLMDHAPRPDYIYQFSQPSGETRVAPGRDTYWLENLKRLVTISDWEEFKPSTLPDEGSLLFVFHETRIAELDKMRTLVPGGEVFHTEPLNFPNATSHFAAYEIHR